jgi:hypothetical protein
VSDVGQVDDDETNVIPSLVCLDTLVETHRKKLLFNWSLNKKSKQQLRKTNIADRKIFLDAEHYVISECFSIRQRALR